MQFKEVDLDESRQSWDVVHAAESTTAGWLESLEIGGVEQNIHLAWLRVARDRSCDTVMTLASTLVNRNLTVAAP